ncbi:hypothetical protein ACGEDE_19790 [Serratia marcescens]|uniref:hypothetical protein n=1 Tax=Serratia marcescens TaxID=615 RepID=UPI002AB56578|nr:hypothetical protein [Serratia marcescens]MDY7607940.1 hypothetical protein [Serratia marcescens]BEO13073.1 hypothetical protein SMQC17_11030 [Serratia marcescens]
MTTIKRFTPDYKMHAVRFEAFAREAEHGEYVRFDAHQQKVSALEAERDALAVENAALKKFCKNAAFDADYESELCMERGGFTDALNNIETPATDAALAAIQAQGVEKYAADLDQIASESNPAEPRHTVASSYADDARSFAKKLREAK